MTRVRSACGAKKGTCLIALSKKHAFLSLSTIALNIKKAKVHVICVILGSLRTAADAPHYLTRTALLEISPSADTVNQISFKENYQVTAYQSPPAQMDTSRMKRHSTALRVTGRKVTLQLVFKSSI